MILNPPPHPPPQFDAAMARALERRAAAKATLRGRLDVYRYIDNVWTFVVSDATLRVAPRLDAPRKDEEEVKVDGPLKLVLVDAKLAGGGGGGEGGEGRGKGGGAKKKGGGGG
jgi:hypothetical protein